MKSIHLIGIGEWGNHIVERISAALPGTSQTIMPEHYAYLPSDRFPATDLLVLASWRPAVEMCKQLDQLAFHWKVPWLPVIMDHPNLRMGPLVVPGESACYHCFECRMLQHSPFASYVSALHKYYDQHPAAGPKGYLRSTAGWAAMHTVQLFKKLNAGDSSVIGSVWQMNVVTRDSLHTEVVGVHGCPRCGLGRSEETRSIDELEKDLDRILGISHQLQEVTDV